MWCWSSYEGRDQNGTWRESGNWSAESTWNSSKKDPGPPGSPNADSNWVEVGGDGQDTKRDHAAPPGLESEELLDGSGDGEDAGFEDASPQGGSILNSFLTDISRSPPLPDPPPPH